MREPIWKMGKISKPKRLMTDDGPVYVDPDIVVRIEAAWEWNIEDGERISLPGKSDVHPNVGGPITCHGEPDEVFAGLYGDEDDLK